MRPRKTASNRHQIDIIDHTSSSDDDLPFALAIQHHTKRLIILLTTSTMMSLFQTSLFRWAGAGVLSAYHLFSII